jgi:redox-sensitive bicupin YhaK (pirin superfamily)
MTRLNETRRKMIEIIKAHPASDGDGVKLLRVFGGQQPQRFDPFLLMDEFGSEEASDYIGGFPPHPHRGFETITYMLQGKMEHRDHMENVGLLNDGDVQWMTAGRGVIHSEMPRQTEGRMRGFQVWLNLPAANKMMPAEYKDIGADTIPVHERDYGSVKTIAGKAVINGESLTGVIERLDTEPLYWDVHLKPGQEVTLDVADGLTSLTYVYDGAVAVNADGGETQVAAQHLARFTDTGAWYFHNRTAEMTRFVVLAGKPLGEPIAQYGPFVMNTPAEIDQAIRDYREGVLV